jgi:polysaccharide export outer membrane protein
MSRTIPGNQPVFVITCFLLGFCFSAFAQQNEPPTPNLPPIERSTQTPTPTPPAEQAKPAQPGGPAAGGGGAGAPVDSSKYKIGPADVLLIRVWHEDAFSGPVVVHQDGKFTLPLVGDLDAGGKTPMEVQEIITKALTKYVVKPLVTVTVQEVGSKRYYMNGLINRPGEYSLVVPTTILDAISKAGGLQDFANPKKIYVLRGSKRIYFNYKDVSHGKHMEENIELEPGDYVFVP